ncbi:sugar ABC transporter substrate-binding protein [Cryobacterium glaciale]|uniref:Sugar ABC transporter substrate-binding protein n=1 Tax=Cryobacterium glaciale TaxID=1259145 RepID=A0A4R8USH8_9MICO|nr:sugar ABC transporter substrate-binding protein [Cryobacterium glaciale]TFB68639.1 sugar ABC transporter substrate-binding protein [Cryobacterium glaciale]
MKTRRKFVVAVALTAAAALGLTACSPTAGTPSSSDDGKTKIAVLLYSQGFEFMVALGQGIKDKAQELGVEVTILDAKGDSSAQISQIQDQLAQGVDGFVLSPNNSDELVPGVQMIHDAGKKVVTVDSVVTGDIADAAVAYNNELAGKLGAEELAKLMDEKGTLLEFEGAKGAYHAILRGNGFKEGAAEFTDIEVISRDAQWTADNALSIAVDNFTVDPNINGLFSHNDEMVRGIVSGLEQIGKSAKVGEPGHIPLVGVDGTPLALDRIRDGSQDATMNQDPFVMGALGLSTMVDILNGKTVEALQLTEPSLITAENVDDPELWGNVFK